MTCIEKEFIDVNSVLSRVGNIKQGQKWRNEEEWKWINYKGLKWSLLMVASL